ncbi:hypothetical protein M5D96_004655 [Drosophila gunungcola]|uniref:Uncharacterized protein n=1 Tax=Drosophila gunungcola TaxID=103775 RepID=A0A9Q0BT90_9MUSC|nr:hypothetical protein M5D96_004655 [Drosophila gunungcola]
MPYIWRSLQEEPEDAVEEDENWFGNLNPEQSVEVHRRQRFEAAAGVMENVAGEESTKLPPLRRRETYS